VHLEQYDVVSFSVVPTIGPLFLANFIGATAFGLVLLVPTRRGAGRVWPLLDSLVALAGIGLSVGAFAGLLVSEHTPLFGFMEHGYRLEIVLALAAEAVAAMSLSVFLACVLSRTPWLRRREPTRQRPTPPSPTPKRELTMPRLYMVTLPGLDVKSDWRVVHDRLLDDFPKVSDVLPTTTPATLRSSTKAGPTSTNGLMR
jgi:hypothetical protein